MGTLNRAGVTGACIRVSKGVNVYATQLESRCVVVFGLHPEPVLGLTYTEPLRGEVNVSKGMHSHNLWNIDWF